VLSGAAPLNRIRATNTERQQTVERMGRALADGCLTVAEFDERVAAAWAAKTRGELAGLVDDLPADRPAPIPPLVHRRAGSPMLRGLTAVWLVLSLVSVAIWVASGVAAGGLATPWWIWVVGAPGACLATSWYICDHRT
jgi:hypothetical protein